MSFSSFNLSAPLQKALKANSYTKPTPIQSKVIPLILDGQDIMAKAQTGSGKSASFVLPVLQEWSKNRDISKKGKIKVLVY